MFYYHQNLQRKGITPIIAVVLLLMMTVAAAGLAYTWVIGVQTSIQEKVAKEALSIQEKRPLTVVQVAGNVSNPNLTLTIQNPGTDWAPQQQGLIIRSDGRIDPNAALQAPTIVPSRSVREVNVTGVRFPWLEKGSTTIELIFIDGSLLTYTCRNQANANNTLAVC